jgi:hypothetical protein
MTVDEFHWVMAQIQYEGELDAWRRGLRRIPPRRPRRRECPECALLVVSNRAGEYRCRCGVDF